MQKVVHGISGVTSLSLEQHSDERGSLTEIHRQDWVGDTEFIQWNMVASHANVLRGVHVHYKHFDYLLVTSGKMQLGLKDIRSDSATKGRHDILTLEGTVPTIWIIPPGVAHGFYFPVDSTVLYGVSSYWDTKDEIACRWDAPDLGFTLTDTEPLLSPRDAAAGNLADMVEQYEAELNANA